MLSDHDDNSSPLDLLVFGAHPDDAELFAGGTIALLAERGYEVRIVHLTRGETATRGTPAMRERESAAAAEILKVREHLILNLGDTRIENSHQNRRAVVEVLRRYKPAVVLTHGPEVRHPDHARAHELVRDSVFLANVVNFHPTGERHQVRELVYWLGHETRQTPKPDFVVDVSRSYSTKVKALRSYSTQFYSPELTIGGPQTYLTSPDFWEAHEARARSYGNMVGAQWGEPYLLHNVAHAEHAFIKMLSTRPN